MFFFESFGTHVAESTDTGGSQERSSYFKYTYNSDQIKEYKTENKNNRFSLGFWTFGTDGKDTHNPAEFTNEEGAVFTSAVKCSGGSCGSTGNDFCGSITNGITNLVPVRYRKLMPIHKLVGGLTSVLPEAQQIEEALERRLRKILEQRSCPKGTEPFACSEQQCGNVAAWKANKNEEQRTAFECRKPNRLQPGMWVKLTLPDATIKGGFAAKYVTSSFLYHPFLKSDSDNRIKVVMQHEAGIGKEEYELHR